MSRIKNLLKKIPLLQKMVSRFKKGLPQNPFILKGENNSIQNLGTFEQVSMDIIGNNNQISIGKNSRISNTLFFIRGDYHRIIIGDNCFFGKGELWIEDDNGSIIIKDGTTIEHAHLAVTESHSKLEIGEDCMLSKHVEIRTGDSHAIVELKTGKRINPAANVLLQRHVWVGAHAKILKGVTIGHNAIIGTAALVTTDVPAHSIAAGVPAKVIKEGIDWKRDRSEK